LPPLQRGQSLEGAHEGGHRDPAEHMDDYQRDMDGMRQGEATFQT
jgi:hypothetical protein